MKYSLSILSRLLPAMVLVATFAAPAWAGGSSNLAAAIKQRKTQLKQLESRLKPAKADRDAALDARGSAFDAMSAAKTKLGKLRMQSNAIDARLEREKLAAPEVQAALQREADLYSQLKAERQKVLDQLATDPKHQALVEARNQAKTKAARYRGGTSDNAQQAFKAMMQAEQQLGAHIKKAMDKNPKLAQLQSEYQAASATAKSHRSRIQNEIQSDPERTQITEQMQALQTKLNSLTDAYGEKAREFQVADRQFDSLYASYQQVQHQIETLEQRQKSQRNSGGKSNKKRGGGKFKTH